MQQRWSANRGTRRASALVLALLVVCSCERPPDAAVPPSAADEPANTAASERLGRMEFVARDLGADDWQMRHDAVRRLGEFGTSANDAVLPLLRDPCDVVRRAAQKHFIRLGESTVPYLVEQLVDVEHDEGFFARIAGGTERSEIKSLAGTLWMTLARGTPRERRLERARDLIAHDAPRVRAVGLFTAAAMRDVEFLRLLEPIAENPDPMVRERFWESLVLLLAKRSGSAPDLDEAAGEQTLAFLAPELLPLLNAEKLGAIDRWQTYGAALAGARVPDGQRARFIAMLEAALGDDRLTPAGAVRAGAVLAGQLEADDLAAAFSERAKSVGTEPDAAAIRQLAALSSFPSSSYDTDALPALLDAADRLTADATVEARGLPTLAKSSLLRALSDGDLAATRRPLASLVPWIAHEDVTLAYDAAVAHSRVLERIESDDKKTDEEEGAEERRALRARLRDELAASAATQADALFERAVTLPLHEVYEVLKLFVLLGDARYLDLFDQLWAHRFDATPGVANVTARPVVLLTRRKDKTILDRVLALAEAPAESRHTSVRDLCAYVFSRKSRYAGFVDEVLTDERFERWIGIMDDPDLHPRTRASFLAMVELDTLAPARRRVLADLALKYSAPPHDSNLRAKALLSLGKYGDRRALAPAYALALEPDHPWWIWQNVAFPLAALHRPPPDPDAPEDEDAPTPTPVLEALIDLLAAQLATIAPRDDEVRLAYSNNYYWWGIEYLAHPADQTAWYLAESTDQDFGRDVAAWRAWLASRDESE